MLGNARALPRVLMMPLWRRGTGRNLVATVAVATVAVASASLVTHVVTGGGTSSCAVATQYVPDGPDNQGGCFPGPSNTGPNAAEGTMTTYTGPCTITTNGTTIDSVTIPRATCSVINVAANNVTISNSYLHQGITQDYGYSGLLIEDIDLDNNVAYPACTSPSSCAAGDYACGDPNNATTDCGITGYKLSVYRSEVYHTNRSFYCQTPDQTAHPGEQGGPCTVQDNYFHGTNLWPDHTNLAHASAARNEQNITFRHNTLFCSYAGPFPNGDIGCSADMSGYATFVPVHHDTIDGNLFVEENGIADYCSYGGGTNAAFSSDPTNATYIVFTNNVFQKGASGVCGNFGHVSDFMPGRTGNVWSGNIWDDGTTAPSG